MAEYTLELRDVVCVRNIFDFPYPFYDENKRKEFERNFIRHFYFREIGTPTIDRFTHFLEDKMLTVFPYYNELFKTAQIEYSVLDNYNVTETFKLTRERTGKSAGVSSTVGQVFDSQNTEVDENRENTGSNHESSGGSGSVKETHENAGEVNSVTNTESEEHTNGTHITTNTVDGEHDTKFLDTPQGLTDVTNSKYITNLTSVVDDVTTTNNLADNVTTESQGSTTANTSQIDSGEKLTASSDTRTSDVETSDKMTGKTNSNFEGEQRSTHDNNTRMENVSNASEDYELVKKGNIGVDTDADMIQKHISLQKVLRRIEMMFFEECEDLFMLVY